MFSKIKLTHGDGGIHTNELIQDVFVKYYGEGSSNSINDAFVFSVNPQKLAYTTDSFVVRPLFFKGGDIGKLSICGTINDLTTAGATPLYISASFIIEEGFDMESLCDIAKSMGEVCRQTGVKIVTGDTKVVEKGNADGLFINTSGIGIVSPHYSPFRVEPDDEIIITGTIAEHGTAILLDRYELNIETDMVSDCRPLNNLIPLLNEDLIYIKLMKDPTRGGLATILNEISNHAEFNIELDESRIPITQQVRAINEMLGIDPLYLACEGRMVLIVKKGFGDQVIQRLKQTPIYADAQIIGRFTSNTQGMVYMQTEIGGKRIIPALEHQTIPRIC
ncbi:hydrogenase expression/formation protein HypE [Clostridium aminobutyricum]|uniref:Hydrogenase expression/formation protein HypE n=1 Tax=Clostridium aminobutyricum TaxID=33953 RepID=A0A939IGU8_CLOAM|nr:hydrogenase expression/formation protein HypE [Clostridium aminobutyricum]MBN7773965.1 hydrogenase expression/formation protein HypE [Clostridium aminobutyricum]